MVAFRPRPELDQLREWCVAGGRLGVRLVTGEGGAGKTRLALQLAVGLARDGWRTLWVQPGTGRGGGRRGAGYRRAHGADGGLCRDQAGPGRAARGGGSGEDCPDLRILLLARSAGEWWRQLLDGADYRLSQVLEDAGPLLLGPLAGGQQGLFDDAVAAFADDSGSRARRPG